MSPLLSLACFLVLGLGLGLVNFGALWLNVRAYAGGAWAPALALHLLRLAVVILTMVAVAPFGPGPMLNTLLGFLVSRGLAVALARSRR